MQNELDLHAWRLKQNKVEENCCYRYLGCCKAEEKEEKLFPDPMDLAKLKALHATNDAPIELHISAEVKAKFNIYKNPNARLELQRAQETKVNAIIKNMAEQMEGVKKDNMRNQLKNQVDFTWNEKLDPKMKFQQAGNLAQYGGSDTVAKGGVLLHQHPLNTLARKEGGEWET